jgi:hypothetical protein
MDHFEVNDFVENEDGSATITVTMDYETLLIFARKGLLATLVDAANKTIEEQSIENEG